MSISNLNQKSLRTGYIPTSQALLLFINYRILLHRKYVLFNDILLTLYSFSIPFLSAESKQAQASNKTLYSLMHASYQTEFRLHSRPRIFGCQKTAPVRVK